MLKPDMIPDGVVDRIWERCEWPSWLDARDAIAAALNAWPGVVLYPPDVLDNTINPTRIILPLPQEASDE